MRLKAKSVLAAVVQVAAVVVDAFRHRLANIRLRVIQRAVSIASKNPLAQFVSGFFLRQKNLRGCYLLRLLENVTGVVTA